MRGRCPSRKDCSILGVYTGDPHFGRRPYLQNLDFITNIAFVAVTSPDRS